MAPESSTRSVLEDTSVNKDVTCAAAVVRDGSVAKTADAALELDGSETIFQDPSVKRNANW